MNIIKALKLSKPYVLLLSIFILHGCNLEETGEQKVNNALVKYESEFWYNRSLAHVLLNRMTSDKTQVIWSTNFHTSAPVPIGAVGPERFTKQLQGIIQNDSLGRILKKAVKENINVILIIGDGMGNMHMSLPIYLRYAQKTNKATWFEKIMSEGACGYLYTNTARGIVTGSAASGTAIACGEKTLMNMVGVDSTGTPLQNVMELAKQNKYTTAIVSDAGITDATPAAFYSHCYNRNLESNIAHQLFSSNTVDIILGGGGSQFIPQGSKLSDFYKNNTYSKYSSSRQDSINLLNSFANKGYELCFSLEEMQAASHKKILGLFDGGGLPAHISRNKNTENIPTVTQMGQKALEIASKDNDPYFAMIECARIDWESHDNDIVSTYVAVEEMNNVIGVAYQYYKQSPHNTLLIFTSDHETGGLEIAYKKVDQSQLETKKLKNGEIWENNTNPLLFKDYEAQLKGQSTTISHIFRISKSAEDLSNNLRKYAGININKEEADLLFYALNNYRRYKD